MRARLRPHNTNKPAAFSAMYPRMQHYCRPAVSLSTGGKPLASSGNLKPGNRKNHTFEFVAIQQAGQLAYQIAQWTVLVTTTTGETAKASGNTV